MLWHPEVVGLSCRDCQTWVYDFRNATWAQRGGKRQRRKAGQLPPCFTCPVGTQGACPKGSPDQEQLVTLSRRNREAVEFWRRAKAGAITDDERADPVCQETLALIEQIMADYTEHRADKRAMLSPPMGILGGAKPTKEKTDGRRAT